MTRRILITVEYDGGPFYGWQRQIDGSTVQQVLEQSPHSGALFAFRGKRGDLIKLLWFDGQGMCLFSKRMDRGKFVWPVTKTGKVSLTSAQLSMLLEGIDWRRPERTAVPLLAG